MRVVVVPPDVNESAGQVSQLAAWSQCGMLYVLSFACLIAFVFTYTLVPETRGRSLEQISRDFKSIAAEMEGGDDGQGVAGERAPLVAKAAGATTSALFVIGDDEDDEHPAGGAAAEC